MLLSCNTNIRVIVLHFAPMKALKSFLVWILLIALPLQGFAAVSMSMCAPGQAVLAAAAAKAQAGHGDVMAGSAADCGGHHATPPPADPCDGCDPASDGGKCSTCATCSVGAPIMAAFATLPQINFHSAGPIPYFPAHATACIYGALERPPHTLA